MGSFGQYIAVALLTSFVLPNTVWAYYSMVTLIPQAEDNEAGVGGTNLLAAAAMFICLFYMPGVLRVRDSRLFLWFLLLIYTSLYAAQSNRLVSSAAESSIMVLVPMAIGLLAAMLCSNTYNIAGVVVVLGSMQALYTIYYFVHGQDSFYSGVILRAGGTFGRPNFVYWIILFCLPLAVGLAVSQRPIWQRAFWALCAAILFSALVLTWYRGGIIAINVALAWLAWRVGGRRMFFIVGLALLLCTAATLVVRDKGSVNHASSTRSIYGRYQLWRVGGNVFCEHWLIGVGVGRLRIVLPPVQSDPDGIGTTLQPQNLVLYWLDEMGVGGGILFALFVMGIVRVVRENLICVPSDQAALGVGAAWIALFVAGLTDTPFGVPDRPCSNALLGALLGATLLLPGKQNELSRKSSKRFGIKSLCKKYLVR